MGSWALFRNCHLSSVISALLLAYSYPAITWHYPAITWPYPAITWHGSGYVGSGVTGLSMMSEQDAMPIVVSNSNNNCRKVFLVMFLIFIVTIVSKAKIGLFLQTHKYFIAKINNSQKKRMCLF